MERTISEAMPTRRTWLDLCADKSSKMNLRTRGSATFRAARNKVTKKIQRTALRYGKAKAKARRNLPDFRRSFLTSDLIHFRTKPQTEDSRERAPAEWSWDEPVG